METYTVYLMGRDGAAYQRLDIMALDVGHARELACDVGVAMYGRRRFSFVVHKGDA